MRRRVFISTLTIILMINTLVATTFATDNDAEDEGEQEEYEDCKHQNFWCVSNNDGTHEFMCKDCEQYEFAEDCKYDENTCMKCGYVLVLPIAPISDIECEHNSSHVVSNSNGTHDWRCDACNELLMQEDCRYDYVTNKCGLCGYANTQCNHPTSSDSIEWGIWEYWRFSDNGDNTHQRICTKCDKTVISSEPHDYSEGSECAQCGAIRWHTWKEYVIHDGPVCEYTYGEYNGLSLHYKECTMCEEVSYVEDSAEHTYSSDTGRCTMCGLMHNHDWKYSYSSQTEDIALCEGCGKAVNESHSIENGVCTKCGTSFGVQSSQERFIGCSFDWSTQCLSIYPVRKVERTYPHSYLLDNILSDIGVEYSMVKELNVYGTEDTTIVLNNAFSRKTLSNMSNLNVLRISNALYEDSAFNLSVNPLLAEFTCSNVQYQKGSAEITFYGSNFADANSMDCVSDKFTVSADAVFKQAVPYTVETYLEGSDEVNSSYSVIGFVGDPISVTLSDIDGYVTPEINEVFAPLSDTNDGIIKLIYTKNKTLVTGVKTNDDSNQNNETTSGITNDSDTNDTVCTYSQDNEDQGIVESSAEVVTAVDNVNPNYSGLNIVDEQSQYVTSPKTGDTSDMQIYLVLCLISLSAIVVIARRLVAEIQYE